MNAYPSLFPAPHLRVGALRLADTHPMGPLVLDAPSVGAMISRPCPRRLASDRLAVVPSLGHDVVPVVGVDFSGGPWERGYARKLNVSPAGWARLPDGSSVHVSRIPTVGALLDSDGSDDGDDDGGDGSDNSTILGPGGTSQSPTILGPGGTSPTSTTPGGVLGPSSAPTGTDPGYSYTGPSLPNVTSALKWVLVAVLVGVGLWFVWPFLSAIR